VRWAQDDHVVVVDVQDAGPGIPEASRAILFTRFGRVPGSRVRAGHVGTGLGLYLSREYAQSMGGELDLHASGATGSTFRLRLPLAGGAGNPRPGVDLAAATASPPVVEPAP